MSKFDTAKARNYAFSRVVLFWLLLCIAKGSYALGCEDLSGEWKFATSGSLSGLGSIIFSEKSRARYLVQLDISPSKTNLQKARGVASCKDGKFVIEVGGFSGKLSNLRLVGGTIVGMLDSSPLNHVFGSWEMLAVDVETFEELEIVGFVRLSKIGTPAKVSY